MWLCTIAAPAAMQASASSAISAGSIGTCGLRDRGVTPLIATSMITGLIGAEHRPASWLAAALVGYAWPVRASIALAFAFVVLGTAGLLSGCTPPATYVALGDSYTSGPAIQPQDPSVPGCLRSELNYPHLVAPDLHLAFRDVSCSGAQTKDMTASQDVDPNPDPAPQFNALNSNTKIVTLGIGGNDIGFVDIAETCVKLATQSPLATAPCRDYYTANGIITDRINALIPRLDVVLDGIASRSPAAKTFVVGYPDILPENPSQYLQCRATLPVATGDIPYLRDSVEKVLNQ